MSAPHDDKIRHEAYLEGKRESAIRIAALEKQNTVLLEALKKLIHPNVPSDQDLRVLIIMAGGTQASIDKAMPMAERLQDAQEKAKAAIASCEKEMG